MPRLALVILVVVFLWPTPTHSFSREVAELDSHGPPYGLSDFCFLDSYNVCSGWVWVYSDVEGAVWGTVLDPNDCPGGCHFHGGKPTDIWFWGLCSPGAPAMINGVSYGFVDAIGCRTYLLWHSGPVTVYSCVSGDRWAHVSVPGGVQCVFEERFALSVEWGPDSPAQMQFATDNGLSNLFCWLGYLGTFPGCASPDHDCATWEWSNPGQVSYVYVTDFNGDTVLDDLCAIYGMPYPLWGPYVSSYGYMPNNLMAVVRLDCNWASSVENTSWGHVKALYE